MMNFKNFIFLLTGICFSTVVMAQYTRIEPVMTKKILKNFVNSHIDYPVEDYNTKKQGTVIIAFNADKYGKITDYRIEQGVTKSIDSFAIFLFKKILWHPATHLGKPIADSAKFKIKYNIKSYNKLSKKRGYKFIQNPYPEIDTSWHIYTFKQLDTIPKPILPTGVKNLNSFIYSKITYPDAAYKIGLTGEVEVSFIIEENGLPSNIEVVKFLGGGCSEEAVRIVELLDWRPGILNGKVVRSRNSLTIQFNKADNNSGYIPNQQGSGI